MVKALRFGDGDVAAHAVDEFRDGLGVSWVTKIIHHAKTGSKLLYGPC